MSLNLRRDDMELKAKIITSKIHLEESYELEMFLALISYLTHNVYIYKIPLLEIDEFIYVQLNIEELKKYGLI